ncbi:hypothetical protein GALMADRAFT_135504 [Galerina marginata CBS 339.88]|uniref:Uncharacterized protein n=1 Tax=Galerina marginata (strain CBS 339.88) TaxID=685588 RepID=A0A067TG61_GALM3|nr:hypothetical protein GALMADRAFT_135504 [Galerina marginata CBS 339.88]
MRLPAGIYMIRNRATGYFIIPNDGSSGGVTVDTTTAIGEVPANARISVQKDANDLYTFKSDSNLSIGVSPNKDDLGDYYLEWQEGDYKWAVRSAGPAQWNIKLPNDPLYAIDDRIPPSQAFVPTSMISTTDLVPVGSAGKKTKATKNAHTDIVTESDNQIKINISISVPYAGGYSITAPGGSTNVPVGPQTDSVPPPASLPTAVPASNEVPAPGPDSTVPVPTVPVDSTAPLLLDANLVLKANGGAPSCARWEFINAG